MNSMVTFLDGSSTKIDELSKQIQASRQKAYVITACTDELIQKATQEFPDFKVCQLTKNIELIPGSIYLIKAGLTYSFNGTVIIITNCETDQLWKHLTKNILNEIYLIGDDLKIIAANQTALENLSYGSKDLNQTFAYQILRNHKKSTFIDIVKTLLKGEKSQITFKGEHVRSDGSYYSVDGSFTLFDAQDKDYLIYYAIDTSKQQKALEEAKMHAEHLHILATNYPGGSISLLDKDLNFIFTSGEAYSKFSIDPKLLIGKNAREILLEENYSKLLEAKHHLADSDSNYAYSTTFNNRYYRNHLKPIFNSEGKFNYYVLSVTDNTLLKEQENRLFIEKNNYTAISNALNRSALVSITDKKGVITHANPSFCEASKFSSKELIGKRHNIINSGYHSIDFWRNMWQTVSQGKTWRAEVKNKAKDGSYYWVDTVINPIVDLNGEIINFLAIRYLITERKELEFNLLQITNKFVLASQAAGIGVWTLDFETREITWDIQIRGISELGFFNGTIEDWLSFIHPDDRVSVESTINQGKMELDDFELETRLVTKTGKLYYINLKASIEKSDRKSTRAIGLTWDITREKLINQNLEEALKDREMMYKELHHRIKNNLQMVNSLLYIRGTHTSDETLKEFIKDTSTKINSISAIHEKLLQFTPMNQLNINEYLITLCDNIVKTYSDRRRTFELDISIDVELFNVDTALNIGLIINEIISNTIKYAYPEAGGKIWVSLKKHQDYYVLKAFDKGIGISPNRKQKLKSSYGMQLIQLFVRQIEGKLELSHNNGTAYTIIFKKPSSS